MGVILIIFTKSLDFKIYELCSADRYLKSAIIRLNFSRSFSEVEISDECLTDKDRHY